MTLNGIKNRVSKWQCVTIPSNCPHAILNDGDVDVVILWTYVSLMDKVQGFYYMQVDVMVLQCEVLQVNPSNHNLEWLE